MSDLDDTRRRVLEAAGPLFAERGFDATSVRDITDVARTSPASVNYHFHGKEHLYVETVRLAAEACESRTPTPVRQPGTPPEAALRDFVHAFLTRVLRDDGPEWARLLIMREIAQPRGGACEEFVRNFVRPSFVALNAILVELTPPGTPPESVHRLGHSIVGQILHYHHARHVIRLLTGDSYTIDGLADHITAFSLAAVRGLFPEGALRMSWIALKMLTGDPVKYLGIVFGVTFAALLMTQQASIFWGLMTNTTSQIRDIEGAEIWVMDPNVRFIDDVKPLSDDDLYRVRGVPGVAWAVRLYKGLARARFDDGNFQQMILLGLDDATMVGAPRDIIAGDLADLRKPDAVIMDEAGYRYLWPNEPFQLGKAFEMNDRRAVIVGICKARPTFQTFPIVYTRYAQALNYVPRERKVLSFILAQPDEAVGTAEVCRRIEEHTRKSADKPGLRAMSREGFMALTIDYYMKRTGIPINFGITVILGFIVGAAIAGQTFYLFTVENLKQFGALKAMGVSNSRLVGMSLLQASVVGCLGYSFGVGGAMLFGIVMEALVKTVPPAFNPTWQIFAMTAVAVGVIVFLASLTSVRKVLVLEPAVVFK